MARFEQKSKKSKKTGDEINLENNLTKRGIWRLQMIPFKIKIFPTYETRFFLSIINNRNSYSLTFLRER